MDSHQNVPGGSIYSRELQQRWRRRLRKRQLKSVFARVQTSSRLFHLVQFVKCGRICPELDSKRLYQSPGEAKEGRCLVLTSSKNTWDSAVSRRSRAATARKCTKKSDGRAGLLFYQSKPIVFVFAALVAVAVAKNLNRISRTTWR